MFAGSEGQGNGSTVEIFHHFAAFLLKPSFFSLAVLFEASPKA
jgi:hypothetical protein